MSPPSAHDAAAPPVAGDPSSFPSNAELARTLLGDGGHATLATLTDDGTPYPSLVAFSTLEDASLLVCISELAVHTRNARQRSEAGLLVAAAPGDGDPLDEPRCSFVGRLEPVEITEEQRARHLDVHPQTSLYVDASDFGWWRMAPERVYFVGGFGWMGWVTGDELAAAEADPVLPHAAGAVAHMNDDHGDANLAMVRHLGAVDDVDSATMTSIDRHGVSLVASTSAGPRMVRLRFEDGPLTQPEQVRGAVVAMAKRAAEVGAR
ncbi:MAG: DUF2470 domain-containing protein [Actinomycetota bacterium]